jgi:pilus assembly protein CpaB
MARIRVFLVLAIAIALGGTFAFATYRYIQNVPAQTVSAPTKPVVVAIADLALGTQLRAEDLQVIAWPADAIPAAAFSDTKELIGRGLVVAVARHEAILPSKLAGVGAGAGLPPAIPEGMRALSVRVNDVIGVAGYVLPGARVDVIATVNPTTNTTDITSKVVLTNVEVLTAGTRIERDTADNKPVAVNVVTLLVNPLEAERLTMASTEGKIQLALRNPLDRTAPVTPGIQPAALLGTAPRRMASAARPRALEAPKPVEQPTVEIIRGDKRAREVVREE